MKKDVIRYISIIVISVLSSCLVSVAATGHLFDSNEVVYDNTSSGMSSSNVKDAVDELYAAATDYSNLSSQVDALNTNYSNVQTTLTNMRKSIEFTSNASNAGHGGFIDFHYNGSSADYTSRIIEGPSGTINITASNGVKINGKTLLDMFYPVGSVYITTSYTTTTQVQNALGGTWSAFGAGRTIVGVNTSDSDFSTVQKTGGSKNHQHSYGFQYGAWVSAVSIEDNTNAGILNYNTSNSINVVNGINIGQTTGNVNGAVVQTRLSKQMSTFRATANTSNVSNVMPYITVYMYKRTA